MPRDPLDPLEDSPHQPDRDAFDVRMLETMAEDEADAEWLRHPEAWHMH